MIPIPLQQNWQSLVNDENDSSLLNRATNGAYPPGSTFKVVTALDYFRKKGTFEGYAYQCEGSITLEDHTIHCYHNAVHGLEDFYSWLLQTPVTVPLQILGLTLVEHLFVKYS